MQNNPNFKPEPPFQTYQGDPTSNLMEDSKENHEKLLNFGNRNRGFQALNYQVPNKITEQEEDGFTPNIEYMNQFQTGQRPAQQSRFYSNNQGPMEEGNTQFFNQGLFFKSFIILTFFGNNHFFLDSKKLRKRCKSEKGSFTQKTELENIENPLFLNEGNKDPAIKKDSSKPVPAKEYKLFEK
jgi:hypothetical protein